MFHGVAHGHELASGASALTTLAGMLLATCALHAVGVAAGWMLRNSHGWLPRAAGAGVALFGAGLLAGLA